MEIDASPTRKRGRDLPPSPSDEEVDKLLYRRGIQELKLDEDSEIYLSSRNVAIEIVRKALLLGILPALPSGTFESINLLFLQPPSTLLLRQTRDRLEKFVNERKCSNLKHKKEYVINSSLLSPDSANKGGKTAQDFLDLLENPKLLHLLILDEFDWGAFKGSFLNTYLGNINQKLEEVGPRTLLFVPVSATAEMLLTDSNYEQYTVKLQDLITAKGNEFFNARSYLSIYQLRYHCEEPKDSRVQKASQLVAQEYVKALQSDLTSPRKTIADHVIKHLHEHPDRAAVLRLGRKEQVTKIKNVKHKHPFQIHDLIDDGEKSKQANLKVSELTGLILVVERLRRGETIPDNCHFYDIRGRYPREIQLHTFKQDIGRCAGHNKIKATVFNCLFNGGKLTKMTPENLTRRCRSLHGTLTKSGKRTEEHPDSEDPARSTKKQKSKKRSARTAKKKKGKVTVPEEEEAEEKLDEEMVEELDDVYVPVFKTLREGKKMVLLVAEPQIGKTGVLFELLKVLDELYFEQVGGSKEQPSSFVKETKRLYALANGSDPDALVKHMGNRDTFAAYHQDMKRVNDAWQTQSAAPVYQIADDIWSALVLDTTTKTKLIVDAGCGLGELAEILIKKKKDHEPGLADEPVKMVVLGLDAPSIDVWNEATGGKWVKDEAVKYVSGDYSSYAHTPAQASFFVYSLSLLRNDITKDIETALAALQHKGRLFIAEMRHRFPPDFTEVMRKKGFCQMRQSNLTAHNATFSLYVFFKNGSADSQVRVVLKDAYTPGGAVGSA